MFGKEEQEKSSEIFNQPTIPWLIHSLTLIDSLTSCFSALLSQALPGNFDNI